MPPKVQKKVSHQLYTRPALLTTNVGSQGLSAAFELPTPPLAEIRGWCSINMGAAGAKKAASALPKGCEVVLPRLRLGASS